MVILDERFPLVMVPVWPVGLCVAHTSFGNSPSLDAAPPNMVKSPTGMISIEITRAKNIFKHRRALLVALCLSCTVLCLNVYIFI